MELSKGHGDVVKMEMKGKLIFHCFCVLSQNASHAGDPGLCLAQSGVVRTGGVTFASFHKTFVVICKSILYP